MQELGVTVVIRDSQTLDDVGQCHASPPIQVGDLVAFENGPPWRVVAMLPVALGARVTPVLARPASLALAAR
jgi:hypothetical protein